MSHLLCFVQSQLSHSVETARKVLDIDDDLDYFWNLFIVFLGEMQLMKNQGDLWMIRSEIEKKSMKKIKSALFGDEERGNEGALLRVEDVNWIKEYQWKIEGDDYQAILTLPVSEYIVSDLMQYDVNDEHTIPFRFRFYRQHSDGNERSAIYLKLDAVPENVKKLRIEVDMRCQQIKGTESKKITLFKQWLKPQNLSKEKEICGFHCFEGDRLEDNMSLEWYFGVKIFKMEKEKELVADHEFLRDLYLGKSRI